MDEDVNGTPTRRTVDALVTVPVVPEADHELERDRIKAKRAAARAVIAGAAAVILAVTALIVLSVDQGDVNEAAAAQAEANTVLIETLIADVEKLQIELDNARAELGRDNADAVDLDECERRFDTLVTRASRDYLGSIGALIVAVARNPAGTPGRDAIIEAAITDIDTTLGVYDDAIVLQEAWLPRPRLPCPIESPVVPSQP